MKRGVAEGMILWQELDVPKCINFRIIDNVHSIERAPAPVFNPLLAKFFHSLISPIHCIFIGQKREKIDICRVILFSCTVKLLS